MGMPAISDDRYAKLAAKRNKRAAERNPLFAFAGVLNEVAKEWTPDDVRKEFEDYAQGIQDSNAALLDKAVRLRAEFAAQVTPEQLVEADRQWQESRAPKDGAYTCEYWRRMADELRLKHAKAQTAAYGYIDQFKRTIMVTDLYTQGAMWCAGYRDPRTGIMVRHMLQTSLPERATQEEAQADLDAYAEWCGLERVEGKQ